MSAFASEFRDIFVWLNQNVGATTRLDHRNNSTAHQGAKSLAAGTYVPLACPAFVERPAKGEPDILEIRAEVEQSLSFQRRKCAGSSSGA